MKVHPEVKELMTEAMREGLKHYRSKTPDQIQTALHAWLMATSEPFLSPMKGIAWRSEWENCHCPTHPCISGHLSGCEGVKRIVFFTPEPDAPKEERVIRMDDIWRALNERLY